MTSTGLVSRAIGWNIVLAALSVTVQIGVTMLLGRLLTASDYGIFAFAYSIIVFSAHLSQRGVSGAILRQPQLTASDIGHVYLVCATMLLAMGVAMVAGWYALRIFGAGRLDQQADILLFLLLPLSVQLLSTPSATLLQRRFAVVKTNLFQIAGIAFGNGLGTGLCAWYGYGAWSLAYGTLAAATITGVLSMVAGWTEVRFEWDLKRYGQFLYDAIAMNGLRALDVAWLQIPLVFLGIYAPPASAGIYQRMQFFADILLQMTVWRVGTVLYTEMAVHRGAGAIDKATYRPVFHTLATLTLPIIAFVWTATAPMVAFLLGPAWYPGVGTLRILIIAFGLYTINQAASGSLELGGRFRVRYIAASVGVLSITVMLFMMPIGDPSWFPYAALASIVCTTIVVHAMRGEKLADIPDILILLRAGFVLSIATAIGSLLGRGLANSLSLAAPVNLLLLQSGTAGIAVLIVMPFVFSLVEMSALKEALLRRVPALKYCLQSTAVGRRRKAA